MTKDLQKAIATVAEAAQRITDAMTAKGLDGAVARITISTSGVVYIFAEGILGGMRKQIVTPYGNEDHMTCIMTMIDELPDPIDAARAEHARLLARAADIAEQHGFGHDAP